jgi:hypothetical protein
MYQEQIKILDYFPFQELQSSVREGPKIHAGRQQQTEKCTLELVLNCQFSDTLGASHAGRDSCAHPSLVLWIVSFQILSKPVTPAGVQVRIDIIEMHQLLKCAQFKFKERLVFSRNFREFSRKKTSIMVNYC